MGLNPARTRSFHAYRFCTVHGNELYEPMWPLEALICLWGGFPLLSTGAECSALPPEAVLGRTGRCRGAYGVPENLFSYGFVSVGLSTWNNWLHVAQTPRH